MKPSTCSASVPVVLAGLCYFDFSHDLWLSRYSDIETEMDAETHSNLHRLMKGPFSYIYARCVSHPMHWLGAANNKLTATFGQYRALWLSELVGGGSTSQGHLVNSISLIAFLKISGILIRISHLMVKSVTALANYVRIHILRARVWCLKSAVSLCVCGWCRLPHVSPLTRGDPTLPEPPITFTQLQAQLPCTLTDYLVFATCQQANRATKPEAR